MRHMVLKYVFGLLLLMFALGFCVYILQRPSNERNWNGDQALLPYSLVEGSNVIIHNVRNFSYIDKLTYVPAYYDKTYNLDTLQSVDYIVEQLDGVGAAHTFLSFGFSAGEYVSISVEIRKEVGEKFSPILGILRKYELMYVIADERDVIKLRTNYRKDVVFLYPLRIDAATTKKLFLDMLARANTLQTEPEFYNTLTNNCTEAISQHINAITTNRIPFDYRLIFPKNSDFMFSELGLIDTTLPLEQLRSKYQINNLAEQYADSPDFSARIRSPQQ